MLEQVEQIKASIRAKVEHPFRVLKRQFGYTKVRYRGITKNTAQLDDVVRARQRVDGSPQARHTG